VPPVPTFGEMQPAGSEQPPEPHSPRPRLPQHLSCTRSRCWRCLRRSPKSRRSRWPLRCWRTRPPRRRSRPRPPRSRSRWRRSSGPRPPGDTGSRQADGNRGGSHSRSAARRTPCRSRRSECCNSRPPGRKCGLRSHRRHRAPATTRRRPKQCRHSDRSPTSDRRRPRRCRRSGRSPTTTRRRPRYFPGSPNATRLRPVQARGSQPEAP